VTTMAPDTHAALSLVVALVVLFYLAPTIVALARDVVCKTEVIVLNLLLGWTGAAWVWALVLACGTPRPRPQPAAHVRPSPAQPAASSVYRDGAYLVSSGPDTHTWAIREDGRWNIVYEIAGEERLTGCVHETDVPLDVLAAALDPDDR
jgi:hypothetical protein